MKTNELKLHFTHGKHVIFVASHRAEELFLHLATQGIECHVNRINGHAEVELEEDINIEAVRSVLSQWAR